MTDTDDIDWDSIEALWQEFVNIEIPVCECGTAKDYMYDDDLTLEHDYQVWVHAACGKPSPPLRKICIRCETQFLGSEDLEKCKSCRKAL